MFPHWSTSRSPLRFPAGLRWLQTLSRERLQPLWACSCSSCSSCWCAASAFCLIPIAACQPRPGLTTKRAWRGASSTTRWCKTLPSDGGRAESLCLCSLCGQPSTASPPPWESLFITSCSNSSGLQGFSLEQCCLDYDPLLPQPINSAEYSKTKLSQSPVLRTTTIPLIMKN